MKKLIYSPLSLTISLMALLAFLLPINAIADGPRENVSVSFFGNVRAGSCNVMDPSVGIVTGATSNDALVFGAPPDRACVPITAPDGTQLTLGQFKSVQGTANVKCVNRGTLVSVHLTGLQPGAVYTAWVPITAGNIFPPALAATALGSVVGDDTFVNVFSASATGQGQITLIQPAGIGTLAPGNIPQCLLDATFEIHIAYHLNGQTSGGVPGPPTTWVVQERFLFPQQ
jgi:hypothetical protein